MPPLRQPSEGLTWWAPSPAPTQSTITLSVRNTHHEVIVVGVAYFFVR
jgi:hypothetical protein